MSEEKGVAVIERTPKVEPDVQYTSATVLQTVTNADGSVSIFQADPNSQVLIVLNVMPYASLTITVNMTKCTCPYVTGHNSGGRYPGSRLRF